MASIEKRQQRRADGSLGPVRWRVVYRTPTGAKRTRTFAKRGDANKFAAVVEADKARQEFVDPRLGKVTFDGWAQQWWATTAGNRDSTRARDWSYLRTHLLPQFGRYEVGEITHLDVRAWVAGLSTWRAPATVQKAFQIMSKVMDAAVDAGMIKNSPCARVPLPKVERQEMRFLNPSEIAILTEAMTPQYRALVLVGAYGGLRIGELAGLRRSRVDILRGRIEVAEIVVEVRGEITTGPPKTKAGRRSITLPRSVTAVLNEHLQDWVDPDPGAYVFAAPHGGPLRTPNWRRRAWATAVRDAGIGHVTPHDLRHSAVALWIASGANVLGYPGVRDTAPPRSLWTATDTYFRRPIRASRSA